MKHFEVTWSTRLKILDFFGGPANVSFGHFGYKISSDHSSFQDEEINQQSQMVETFKQQMLDQEEVTTHSRLLSTPLII